MGTDEDYEDVEASPIRLSKLPVTPISLSQPERYTATEPPNQAEPTTVSINQEEVSSSNLEGNIVVEEISAERLPSRKHITEDFVRDADYYDLYAGPDEIPPTDMTHAYGGDTVSNTEEEPEDIEQAQRDSRSATGDNGETSESDVDMLEVENPDIQVSTVSSPVDAAEEDSFVEERDGMDEDRRLRERSGTQDDPIVLDDAPEIVMPPPNLPMLQTDFQSVPTPGMLTPIGREPSSPIIRPLDSSTLPMPSPFPGERDGQATSYLDYPTDSRPREPSSEANFLVESSFYGPADTTNASSYDLTHESAFTDVRFTFGFDGSMLSRHNAPSKSPEPKNTNRLEDDEAVQGESRVEAGLQEELVLQDQLGQQPTPDILSQFTTYTEHTIIEKEPSVYSGVGNLDASSRNLSVSQVLRASESDVIMLSSDSRSESDEEVGESEDDDFRGVDVDVESHNAERDGDRQAALEPKIQQSTDDSTPMNYNGIEVSESVPLADEVMITNDHDTASLRSTSSFHETLDTSIAQRPKAATEIIDLGSGSDEETGEGEETAAHDIELIAQDKELSIHRRYDQPTDVRGRPREDTMDADSEHEAPRNLLDIKDHSTRDAPFREETSREGQHTYDHHPDIKVESIEEETPFNVDQRIPSPLEAATEERAAGPSAELLIEVPKDGSKVGELQQKPVLATGPARNTRSKTKTSSSPVREDSPAPSTRTRSRRSKTSRASVVRETLSPVTARSRSTVSPTLDGKLATPYSLRSQSKMLSPTKVAAFATEMKSPHRTRRRDGDKASKNTASQAEGVSSQPEQSPFEPSSHSAGEIQPSDLSSNRNSTPKVDEPVGARTRRKLASQQVESQDSMASATLSKRPSAPGRFGQKEQEASNSQELLDLCDTTPNANTPAKDVTYPELSLETSKMEGAQLPSSPPAPVKLEGLNQRASSPAVQLEQASASINQQSLMNSNMPITPEATQQTFTESQATLLPEQQEQSLPMTPQLTQTTSAGLRAGSFNADVEMEEVFHERLVKPSTDSAAPMVEKTSPRRYITTTDVVSRQSSPSVHSEDLSDSEAEGQLAIATEPPSIGLSTPISYYTPLKDLSYFINKSSQFYGSSKPDVLALVTTGTTPPKRADKGPKHWNTTLHITDFSIFPQTRSVQVFRAHSSALPVAEKGDTLLLRGFQVKSLNRKPMLLSGDESAWCVWRWSKPVWGTKKGVFGELKAREEIKGPTVERGEEEWKEVERLRTWFASTVKFELEKMQKEKEEAQESQVSTRATRSKGKAKANGVNGVDE